MSRLPPCLLQHSHHDWFVLFVKFYEDDMFPFFPRSPNILGGASTHSPNQSIFSCSPGLFLRSAMEGEKEEAACPTPATGETGAAATRERTRPPPPCPLAVSCSAMRERARSCRGLRRWPASTLVPSPRWPARPPPLSAQLRVRSAPQPPLTAE
jgi:hypothetical protein